MNDHMNLKTLPGDDIRQIMWRFSERYDLQMVVQSARGVARGPVARLVANGGRNSHEWTEGKNDLLKTFDESGITALFMEPEEGGYIAGPKNLALALTAFELSWVDAGSATCSLASNLALSPIHERGTPEQKQTYMSRCVPPQPGENRTPWRGAFVLTEPLPYVGVDTSVLSGRVRIAEWNASGEPVIQVEKRGRFITGMGFANFVTVAVESDDSRIKGSCMVILEETDQGTFDRGVPTKKMVHQLSSTNDPSFNMKIPASRIIGGYTVKDGVIIPNYSHSEIIEAVFRRTRVTVGLMTSAKLLSAVEPIIRYQRGRFRGGQSATPGTPRYDQGLQQKEDALHRLVDIWATGEASASLGFAAARHFDAFDPLEREKDTICEAQGLKGRAQLRAFMKVQDEALEYIRLTGNSKASSDPKTMGRIEELRANTLLHYSVMDALAQVICPATKLWNTGHGATTMREAVSLMGGYGITEDCPGFLGQKWMDAQLEATYEGPEAVQRRQLSITMTNELFLAQMRQWIAELREIDAQYPEIGASAVGKTMELWLWTLDHLQKSKDANGKALYHNQRHGVAFAMADALCWILASRFQIADTLELRDKGMQSAADPEGMRGFVSFFTNLCHVQAARAAGEVSRICTELFHAYSNEASASGTQIEAFTEHRNQLDLCLRGARLSKDRAAQALTQVMIPEALDYPV